MQWLPPENVGPLPPLSFYEIIATPRLDSEHVVIGQSKSDDSIPVSTSSRTSSVFANRSPAQGFDSNTTCIEVTCERVTTRIDATLTTLNLSGLVPALRYELVVHALSNGTSLISRPSDVISVVTQHFGNCIINSHIILKTLLSLYKNIIVL